MKRRATKKERQTPKAVLQEVCLRAGGKWNPESKKCTGGHCEICHGTKMDIRGLKFAHIKRRKMGGTTSPEIHSTKNVKRTCYVCDDENDGVRLPKPQPVDKPTGIFALSGYHGTGRPFSKEAQAGLNPKRKRHIGEKH